MCLMKITDDYHAKVKLWAASPTVIEWVAPEGLPHFGHRRFDSLEEMNAWKREYRLEIARSGGLRWNR